jgi:hypothetical protein
MDSVPGLADTTHGIPMALLLRSHLTRYPLFTLKDLYKLLHQGVLGSEHAVTSEPAAREWLEREIAGLGPGPEEPLIDVIACDGRIARVHLRPFLAGGGDPEVLLRAFVHTANEHRRSGRELRAAWREATILACPVVPIDGSELPATAAPVGRGVPAGSSGSSTSLGPSRSSILPFTRPAMDAFFAPLEAAGFPALHHSKEYERAYAPAYRVVRVDCLASSPSE